jgi:hypothetical protein
MKKEQLLVENEKIIDIVNDFAYEEGVDQDDVDAVVEAISLNDFTVLSRYQWFLLADSLGCYDDRTQFMEVVYQMAWNTWAYQTSTLVA